MKKDITKKLLMREKRYLGRMLSFDIINFLYRTSLIQDYDMMVFSNMLGAKNIDINTDNRIPLSLKEEKKLKTQDGKIVEFNMVYCYIQEFDDNSKTMFNYPFWIGETEVSFWLYESIHEEIQGHAYDEATKHKLPVHLMSWEGTIVFCNKLSELEGFDPYYEIGENAIKILGGNGYRLPYQIEWECAAKAGTKNKWSGTNDARLIGDYAWYKGNANPFRYKPNQIATKKPNEWGIYDMSGNVAEWCHANQDNKTKYVKENAYGITKGGHFAPSIDDLAISNTKEEHQRGASVWVGFRIARNAF
jgi:formylglycine-generating enzyme required for sulfatase activity